MTDPALKALGERLAASFAALADKPEETPDGAARALWLAAAGLPVSVEAAAAAPLPRLDAGQSAALEALVARRLGGEPLAHITGRQRFMGLDFLAGPEALVPRKETELLGRLALGKLQAATAACGEALAIDVCTGSGNLAVALGVLVPGSTIHAADLSPEAVALARRNAALHGVAERVSFVDGDLFAPLPRERLARAADLVVCNPPYISSAKVETMPEEIARFEPRLAFDGGAFGLSIVGRLTKEAPDFLKPGGWLCFEIGKGQGPYWQKALGRMSAYRALESVADADGDIRALAAQAV